MNNLATWQENLAVFSRTAQAALLVSIAIHVVIVSLIVQLYQAPQPAAERWLEIELQGLSVQEFEIVEQVVEPIVEIEVAEELSIETEEPVEEEMVVPDLPPIAPVIATEAEDAETVLRLEVPVAVLVHPDTLEEFVRADSEYTRVPSYKSFEEQLRQENYFNSWVDKVTSFGKRAIPSTTTRQTFHGEVKMHVVLQMDGELEHVKIIDRAQLGFLNDLALSIVRMASPYAPVPTKLLNREGKLVFQPKIVFRNKLAWVE